MANMTKDPVKMPVIVYRQSLIFARNHVILHLIISFAVIFVVLFKSIAASEHCKLLLSTASVLYLLNSFQTFHSLYKVVT